MNTVTRLRPRWILATLTAAAALGLAVPAFADSATREPRDPRARTTTHASASDQPAAGPVVNVNTATATELEELPGVGPTRAAAILALRQRLGRFTRVEDLLRVRGIGRATLRRMRTSVSIEGSAQRASLPPRRARVPDAIATSN